MISAQRLWSCKLLKKKPKAFKTEGDFFLLILVLAISVFGIVMIYSASYYHSISKHGIPHYFLKNDLLYKGIGWISFILLANFNYHRLAKYSWPILLVGIGLLVFIYAVPSMVITINDARRWINFFDLFTIMPGEIIKTCLILFMSWFLTSRKDCVRDPKSIAFLIFLTAIIFLLIAKQPNVSTAGSVVVLSLGMLFFAGLPKLVIGVSFLLALLGGGAYIFAKGGYLISRINAFLDPWEDPLGQGYQVIQSLLALGSGGVLGLGLGNSIQKMLYLPYSENDFIAAIIGEELGYIGLLLLLIAYMLLIWRCFRAAVRARDSYGMLLASGVGLHIAIQVILNIAVVSASFFPTGVVLPLVSMGGNATMLFLAELAIVYNVSRYPCEQSAEPAEDAAAGEGV